jgi:AbrB family looped-hinge helix DNA binding protein
MTIEIKLSSKGQVVIPKDVRDALNLGPGATLQLSWHGRTIMLDAGAADRPKISYDEFRRRVPRYDGPPVATDAMTARVDDLFRDWNG